MILLLDNYDSFTFNLAQALGSLGPELRVVRNDAESVDQLLSSDPSCVVLSPGPDRPERAGVMLDLLAALPERVPVLGVCLGHQALVVAEGGELETDAEPVHGESSLVHHDGSPLFRGLRTPFRAGRYHSLRARRDRLPESLEAIAFTDDGVPMAVRHRELPRFGVQFHPESILTPQGQTLLANFLALVGEPVEPSLVASL